MNKLNMFGLFMLLASMNVFAATISNDSLVMEQKDLEIVEVCTDVQSNQFDVVVRDVCYNNQDTLMPNYCAVQDGDIFDPQGFYVTPIDEQIFPIYGQYCARVLIQTDTQDNMPASLQTGKFAYSINLVDSSPAPYTVYGGAKVIIPEPQVCVPEFIPDSNTTFVTGYTRLLNGTKPRLEVILDFPNRNYTSEALGIKNQFREILRQHGVYGYRNLGIN